MVKTGTVTVSAKFEIVEVRGGARPVRNIIIMLGDGMGVAHRSAARIVRYGVAAGRPKGFLAMDQFPGTGLITTYSLNSVVTDSSPGRACYSTGNHADNNQEGVFPAHVKNPFYAPRVEYMSEYLHRLKRKSLGLVTTADGEDATPAANAVHTGNRNTAVHPAADVPVSAYSSKSQAYRLFHGVQENTDVFFKLMRAALGGFN